MYLHGHHHNLHASDDSIVHLSRILGAQAEEGDAEDENRAERERNNDNRRDKRNVFQWEGK